MTGFRSLSSAGALTVCRNGIVVVFATLVALSVDGPSVSFVGTPLQAATCGDSYCDREFAGENCGNCSSDCDCICGDEICTGTQPYNETCGSCETDCWDSCICGDFVCNYPAEGGGTGSGQECQYSGFENCETCTTDCGTCSALFCYLDESKACNSQSGECVECDNFYECMDGDPDFACVSGMCVYVPSPKRQ